MAVWPPRRLALCRAKHMARGHGGDRSGEKDDIVEPGILRNLQLWHSVGRAEKVLWVFSGPETAFSIDMDPVRLPPIKLITYSGSRALRQPDTERSLKKHYLKAIKMHAKRTLFNYGKIFVITRPLPSTIPIPTLFSHPPCLTLQPTTPLMITNCPTSSKRVLSWRGTQTRAKHLHLRKGVAVVPRAARTRRALRAQPLPRPKLPQRLARRGKGVDLLNPRMSRRRVCRVNPLRNAREEGHQSIPSLALPTRMSGR